MKRSLYDFDLLDRLSLSPSQRAQVLLAVGDGRSWPAMTSDPYVNYAVDMLVEGEIAWEYNEQEYQAEIAAYMIAEDR